MRVDEIVYDAAKLVPGLTPTQKQVDAENPLMQSEKDGVEIDQGIFLAQVLALPDTRRASLPRHAAAEAGSGRRVCPNSSRTAWSISARRGWSGAASRRW